MWKKEFVIKRGVLVRYNGEAKEIVLPKKVKAIGEKVFFENNDLCSITFPEGCRRGLINAGRVRNKSS